MHQFNYCYLQWYTDTNNLLQFTNLHDLSAFGNYLYYIYGTKKRQEKKISSSSNFTSEALIPMNTCESYHCPRSLHLAWPYCHNMQHGHFSDCGPILLQTPVLGQPFRRLLGIRTGGEEGSNLTAGCSASSIKTNREKRKRGKYGCANAILHVD